MLLTATDADHKRLLLWGEELHRHDASEHLPLPHSELVTRELDELVIWPKTKRQEKHNTHEGVAMFVSRRQHCLH